MEQYSKMEQIGAGDETDERNNLTGTVMGKSTLSNVVEVLIKQEEEKLRYRVKGDQWLDKVDALILDEVDPKESQVFIKKIFEEYDEVKSTILYFCVADIHMLAGQVRIHRCSRASRISCEDQRVPVAGRSQRHGEVLLALRLS
eukprot:766751-Hanusia_phi.AAC.6